MSDGALIDLLRPQDAALSRELWAAAAFIGGLRTASNGATRRGSEDRGAIKNAVNDTQGLIGELVVLRRLGDVTGWAAQHDLLDWDGPQGRTTPDVTLAAVQRSVTPEGHRDGQQVTGPVSVPARELRLEAKAHLHVDGAAADATGIPIKRDFAVNCAAVVDSTRIGAEAMIPLATMPGGQLVRIGRPISLNAVLDWEIVDYGDHAPAYRMPLAAFSPLAFDEPWAGLADRLERAPKVISAAALRTTHDWAMSRFDELRTAEAAGTGELRYDERDVDDVVAVTCELLRRLSDAARAESASSADGR